MHIMPQQKLVLPKEKKNKYREMLSSASTSPFNSRERLEGEVDIMTRLGVDDDIDNGLGNSINI